MAVGRSGKGLAFGPAARRTVAGWGAQGGCPRLFRTGLVRLPAVRGPCLGQPAARAPPRARRGGAAAPFGLAWVVGLLCVALASGSLLLALLNGRTLDEIFFEEGLITL